MPLKKRESYVADNSTSLNRYLNRTYDLSGGIPVGGDGFMEVVAATQSPDSQKWAEGPADTVRQWLSMMSSNSKFRKIEDILVLPSDQVYRMDFAKLVAFHRENYADITIVCQEVQEAKVQQFGIVKLDKTSKITQFSEKPKGDTKTIMSMDWEDLDQFLDQGSALLNKPTSKSHDGGGNNRAYVASCGLVRCFLAPGPLCYLLQSFPSCSTCFARRYCSISWSRGRHEISAKS